MYYAEFRQVDQHGHPSKFDPVLPLAGVLGAKVSHTNGYLLLAVALSQSARCCAFEPPGETFRIYGGKSPLSAQLSVLLTVTNPKTIAVSSSMEACQKNKTGRMWGIT